MSVHETILLSNLLLRAMEQQEVARTSLECQAWKWVEDMLSQADSRRQARLEIIDSMTGIPTGTHFHNILQETLYWFNQEETPALLSAHAGV